MALAPIILFVYNRPLHTLKALEALALNHLAKDSVLHIFADGVKKNADKRTIQKINETRDIIKSKQWCKEVIIHERTENLGLAESIIEGVSEILTKYGKVIVLEDDLVSSPYFLKFMNDSLDYYEKEEKVVCISAYFYPVDGLPETFFIKGADCWGWATWSREWNLFEKDGEKLLKELESKKLTSKFDINNSYPYTQMLRDQINGVNNSWAIRWYASAFLNNKLCLYPGQSLINNIGTDGSGTHDGSTTVYETKVLDRPIILKNIKIEENTTVLNKLNKYFLKLELMGNPPSLMRQLLKKIIPNSLINIYRQLRYSNK